MSYAPAFPKNPSGKSRREERTERNTAAEANRVTVYRTVDLRDQGHCRVCRCRVDAHAIDMLQRGHHHHLVFRSQGGPDATWNLVTICWRCHEEIHTHGTMKLEGDADAKDERGRLCGVCVKRPGDGTWEVERWV